MGCAGAGRLEECPQHFQIITFSMQICPKRMHTKTRALISFVLTETTGGLLGPRLGLKAQCLAHSAIQRLLQLNNFRESVSVEAFSILRIFDGSQTTGSGFAIRNFRQMLMCLFQAISRVTGAFSSRDSLGNAKAFVPSLSLQCLLTYSQVLLYS